LRKNRTLGRQTEGFSVPYSCCKKHLQTFEKDGREFVNKDCGKHIPYGDAEFKKEDRRAADEIINNITRVRLYIKP